MMESLDDLKDAYHRLKEKGIKFDHISDHGLSLGIYFRDPDGNGLEVSYELPREKWPRKESVFAPDVVHTNWDQGRFGRAHVQRLLGALRGQVVASDITGEACARPCGWVVE